MALFPRFSHRFFLQEHGNTRIPAARNAEHQLNRRSTHPGAAVLTVEGGNGNRIARTRGRFAAARFKHRKVTRHPLRAYAPLAHRAPGRRAQYYSEERRRILRRAAAVMPERKVLLRLPSHLTSPRRSELTISMRRLPYRRIGLCCSCPADIYLRENVRESRLYPVPKGQEAAQRDP